MPLDDDKSAKLKAWVQARSEDEAYALLQELWGKLTLAPNGVTKAIVAARGVGYAQDLAAELARELKLDLSIPLVRSGTTYPTKNSD